MSYERLRPAFTFDAERIEQLKAIVPEAFADGAINWDALRAALDVHLEDDGADAEHFGLFWPGKRVARRRASEPSSGTLVPEPGEGVNEDTTRNVFIEADNLDALKLLQKAYAGRVKMIYIDPPYNTGQDFVYRDDFWETQREYLRRTGQIDETLRPLTTNSKSDGRFHSNWLNMMYPRLLIAKSLLREDGVMFVSIDDNELHHLRMLMNEVFGEEGYINVVTIKTKPSAGASGGGEDRRLKKNAEFLLIYVRDRETELQSLDITGVADTTDLIEHLAAMRQEGRSWKYTRCMLSTGDRQFVQSITDGAGQEIKIYEHTNYQTTSISRLIARTAEQQQLSVAEAEVVVHRDYLSQIFRDTNAQSSIRGRVMDALGEHNGLFSIEYTPRSGRNKGKSITVYYIGEKKNQVAWLSDIAHTEGTQIVMKSPVSTVWEDFNWNNVSREGDTPFPNGKKPIAFIQQMLALGTNSEDEHIVLDFFAGSGSTGHAVFTKNREDNGNRRFVLVQVPEEVIPSSHEFKYVSDLSKARLRRSIGQLKPEMQPELLPDETDIGFRVYSFAPSNYKAWQDYDGEDTTQLQTLFDQFETPLIDGWMPTHLLTEVMLLQGFPLDSRIEALSTLISNAVQRVTSDFHAHSLFACFDATIADETINALALGSEDIFVCLDSALTDESKTRLSDVCNLRTI